MYEELSTKQQSPEGPVPTNTFRGYLPQEVATGTILRVYIELKCWNRDPNNRPTMKQLQGLLHENL